MKKIKVTKSDKVYVDSNIDYLLIETHKDLEVFWRARKVRAHSAFEYLMRQYIIEGGDDFASFSTSRIRDSHVLLSTFGATSILQAYDNFVLILQKSYRSIKDMTEHGSAVLINDLFGMQAVNIDSIEYVVLKEDMTEHDILDFVQSYKVEQPKYKPLPTSLKDMLGANDCSRDTREVYLVYIPAKKVCLVAKYDLTASTHDKILADYNYKADDGLKLIYYTTKHHLHNRFCEYGITGLKTSVVYDTLPDKEYEPTSYDADVIAKFCKEIEDCIVK